jgi:hypothetical protein
MALLRRENMLRRLFVGIAILFFLFACNKGLTPPDSTFNLSRFSVFPQGGNPVGYWVPDTINPVEVTILDELPIDSMQINGDLDGFFSFAYNEICSVNAVLNFRPVVYIDTAKIEIAPIADTIVATGPFDIIEDKMMQLPVVTNDFDLDTLGFTSSQNTLDLISQNITFNLIMEVRLYFIFHLVRSQELALAKKRQNGFSH